MLPLVLTLVLANHGGPRPAPFDPDRPPAPLPAPDAAAPPVEVVRLSDDAVWLHRRDGHVASVTFSVVVEGALPPGGLAAARCVDLLWPGHTHIMVGSGHTVAEGFDVQAFGGTGGTASFLVTAVAGYEDPALDYVRGLLAGERPAPAREPPAGSLWRPRAEPDLLRLALWAVERPDPIDAWDLDRCLEHLRRSGPGGRIRVAVTAAERSRAERIAALARSGRPVGPARSGTAGRAERTVFVVAWRGEPFEGFAVVGRPLDDTPQAPLAVLGAVLQSTVSHGPLAEHLRNDLGAVYTPVATLARDRRPLTAAQTAPERRDDALRATLAMVREPETWRDEADGLAASWNDVRSNLPGRFQSTPGGIFGWLDALAPAAGGGASTARAPDATRVATALAAAFEAPDVVLVVPRIDRTALAGACSVARKIGREGITVADLPNGGTRDRPCR